MTESYFGTIAIDVLQDIAGKPELPDVLWHYTSSEGLLGILSTSTLRFAEVSYMNDGSELKYGIQLFHEANARFRPHVPKENQYLIERLAERLVATVAHFGSVIFCLCAKARLRTH